MPIYEYRCEACGFQEEYLQKISEPPKTVCPSCGKAAFRKLLSAAGFQLKGSGWYATDFKGGKPAADAKAGAKAGESPPAAEGAKGEAKAETKAEAKGTGESGSSKAETSKAETTPASPAAASGN
ncbi:MAG TPA: zinc ribbon domain-containing protein [Burkholderiales bacterium]|nr:zinc ribbon domain-containing protein [Burkholderiales bacterium]